jgi:PAS domain S-box-containing protein
MSRVLVVDDEEAYRTLMAGHLERKGMNVMTAEDGPNALDLFDSEGAFDVVVTDLMMPVMSGLDLLGEIKQREPSTEVIVITASNEVSKAVSAMREGGAFDYLLKPLESINELSLTVGRALQHRQLVEERQRLNEELDREASRLQALVTYSSEAMLLANEQDVVTVANPAAIELIGAEELVDNPAGDVLPDELSSIVEAWHQMGGQSASVLEIDWPDESTHLVSIAPVGVQSDQARGWVMILRDITHLKQIDELKLRMLNDTAARIRLPLAQAISKLADLSSGTMENEEAQNTTIYQLATILGRIQDWMDELMGLVQLEAGVGFSAQLFSIKDVLSEDRSAQFMSDHQAKGLQLICNLPEELPAVRVDPGLFERMLDGLLERAAQRSQVGGDVEVTVRTDQGQVWIEISDQGLSSSRKPPEKEDSLGESRPHGFGLQMVRAIVQKLGGQVWLQGQDGIGSTIAIALPVVETAAMEMEA